MKTLMVVLAYATLASSSVPRDKRSFAHTQAYPVPINVHTVVRPSSTLPVYEYPESTQIDTHSRTVYSVSVPITHTVHLEQPGHSRQVIYHNPPAVPSYTAPVHTSAVYTPPVHAPAVYTPTVHAPAVYSSHYNYNQVYNPPVYSKVYTPHVQRRIYTITPSQPWAYRRYADPWC